MDLGPREDHCADNIFVCMAAFLAFVGDSVECSNTSQSMSTSIIIKSLLRNFIVESESWYFDGIYTCKTLL